MNTDVVLFGLPHSVYTRIARLALEEKGVAYRLEEVNVFDPSGVPPAHLRRHPFGRIPALTYGDTSLFETAAICRYIDEAFGGPALQPRQPLARARVTQVIGVLDSYVYRPLVWGVFVERVDVPLHGGRANEARVAASLEQARIALTAIDTLMGDGEFLVGTELSLADLHAYPMLECFARAPEGATAIATSPRIVEWMTTLASRSSVQRVLAR